MSIAGQINQITKSLFLTSLKSSCNFNQHVLKHNTNISYSQLLVSHRGKATSNSSYTGHLKRKPLNFEYAGDMMTQPTIPNSLMVSKYKDIDTLDKVSKDVKKLCSIEYASGEEVKQHRIEEMSDRIQLLFGPDSIREQMIAKLTVEIRLMIPHCLQFRKDKRSKSLLVEKIQKRKKYLKFLRKDDYERFEWLLDELQIQYIPPPAYYKFVSKRCKRKSAIKEAAYALRQSKVAALKEKFAAEKVTFLEHKDKVLQEIENDADKFELDKESLKQILVREREKSSKWVVW